jgi:hypothetical protein
MKSTEEAGVNTLFQDAGENKIHQTTACWLWRSWQYREGKALKCQEVELIRIPRYAITIFVVPFIIVLAAKGHPVTARSAVIVALCCFGLSALCTWVMKSINKMEREANQAKAVQLRTNPLYQRSVLIQNALHAYQKHFQYYVNWHESVEHGASVNERTIPYLSETGGGGHSPSRGKFMHGDFPHRNRSSDNRSGTAH